MGGLPVPVQGPSWMPKIGPLGLVLGIMAPAEFMTTTEPALLVFPLAQATVVETHTSPVAHVSARALEAERSNTAATAIATNPKKRFKFPHRYDVIKELRRTKVLKRGERTALV